MPHIKVMEPSQATGATKELLDGFQKKVGFVPNILKQMANSPATLRSYLDFANTLGAGSLSPQLREQIAIAVAEANACEYCLSAHTAIGKMVGLNEHDLEASRRSRSDISKIDAALHFAHELVIRRGELGAADIETVRNAGYSDGEITEIVANVALNIFTNYFNKATGTVVDFPRVAIARGA